MYPDDTRPIYVAEEGGRVLGYAFCQIKPSPATPTMVPHRILYIDDICVDSAARGKHVGKTLYDHVIAYAKEQNFYNVTLNVWSCNTSAMKFYESMGLVPQKVGMEIVL